MFKLSTKLYDDLLNAIVESIQISKTDFDRVTSSYEAVGKWLSDEKSALHKYKPDILPQGSFLFGTIIKPVSEGGDIDIDLVCRLRGKNDSWTQSDLKRIVGDRLKENDTYKRMLEKEGRRCWTLKYSDSGNYHMDVLPSLVAKDFDVLFESYSSLRKVDQDRLLGIRITDKVIDNYHSETEPEFWPKSNPFGYAQWLDTRGELLISEAAKSYRKIFPVPKQASEASILIKVIQLIKRHRDVRYGSDEDKPVSILLTTLAAHAYSGETSLFEALISVLNRMELFIEDKFDPQLNQKIKWVQNPIDPDENFADKWKEKKRKQTIFFKWLNELKDDINQAFRAGDTHAILSKLEVSFGKKTITDATSILGKNVQNISNKASLNLSKYNVPHKMIPLWEIKEIGTVTVKGKYKTKDGWEFTDLGNSLIPKECKLIFTARTNIPPPFVVYWQVVNTGVEARSRNCLRGEIFPSKTAGLGGLQQEERSLYTGSHWIECFIVQNDICVARSGPIDVVIE